MSWPPTCRRRSASAILLLTPLAFLFSTARNSRELADILALGLGLALFPLAALLDSGLDILISGVVAGTIAYGVHKWREGAMSDFCRRLARAAGAAGGGRDPEPDLAHARPVARRRHRRGVRSLMWVKAVATAILAGVIAEILVQPPGALASVPGLLRYGAVVVGFVVFMLTRRSIFAGVVSGEFLMLAGKWWLG